MSHPAPILVETSAGDDYPVYVGRGILARLPELLVERAPAHRYAVICDHRVTALHGHGVRELLIGTGLDARLFTFPGGEANKNRDTWASLTDGLLDAGFGRDAAVVAVGGGVTGDLAGFVAASFMRGVPVAQVPTTLVAMVDASVGGKTGVDTRHGKNLVGAFHPPRFVLADVETIGTLPDAERAQGLAEAVKHGAILDAEYFRDIAQSGPELIAGRPGLLEAAVTRSVSIKARVVGRDEREAGLRKILNFGHTLGHALEAMSEYRLPHGSAVALGMVLEARLGERLGVTASGTAERLAGAVESLGLPGRLSRVEGPSEGSVNPADPEVRARILGLLGADKKVREGSPRFVLLARIGEVAHRENEWVHEVPPEAVEAVLAEG